MALSLFVPVLLLASSALAETAEPAFVPPPAHYNEALSWRGLTANGKVHGYGVSGHAQALPGVHDFLRLVPPSPLSHGAAFSIKPLEAEEWMVEIAFRVHGPAVTGLGETAEDGTAKRLHKGGRGLAFWYTKTGNPGPITIDSQSGNSVAPPPPPSPILPHDPSDQDVSLFGSRVQFDGLGVVFDTSPTQPLFSRSDKRNWDPALMTDQHHGVGAAGGVVSGIMDDGTGKFLEPQDRLMSTGEEAAYLERAIGECEAAFRNANGLLWARISYINNTVRVDLDLSPHTTLAKAGRDYAHNCFMLPGVKLTPGYHVGVSGLASGYTEPDSIDVYAMDVFEIIKEDAGAANAAAGTDDAPEVKESAPLEGTSEDATTTLAHEIFLSQSKMVEAIDSLSRRIDFLSRMVRPLLKNRPSPSDDNTSPAPVGSFEPKVANQLARLEVRISELAARLPGDHAAPKDDKETFTHLLQLQDRLMVELKAFGRKLDTANGQSSASLATLSSRSAESLQMLKDVALTLEESAKQGGSVLLWVGGVAVFVGGVAYWMVQRRSSGGHWDGRKFL